MAEIIHNKMCHLDTYFRVWYHNKHGTVFLQIHDEDGGHGCVLEPLDAARRAGHLFALASYADQRPGTGRKKYGKLALIGAYLAGLSDVQGTI
ncbi:MAG TPA: hypothetical protein ENH62_11025 [Marinobacter sp.]|uniref:Uncharacterized protein n=1 Tax=marine sediment metagenome TaxID=412755 RepID=A0A0F9PSV2_9ZZZZ|nr:hypothetical protein [Marinobacter sp.]